MPSLLPPSEHLRDACMHGMVVWWTPRKVTGEFGAWTPPPECAGGRRRGVGSGGEGEGGPPRSHQMRPSGGLWPAEAPPRRPLWTTCGLTRGRTGASARRGGRRVDPRRSRSRRWARWRRCSRADVRRVSSGSGRFGGDPQEGPWPLLRVQVRPNLGTICKPTARAPKGGGVRVVVEEAAAEGDVLLPARAALA